MGLVEMLLVNLNVDDSVVAVSPHLSVVVLSIDIRRCYWLCCHSDMEQCTLVKIIEYLVATSVIEKCHIEMNNIKVSKV